MTAVSRPVSRSVKISRSTSEHAKVIANTSGKTLNSGAPQLVPMASGSASQTAVAASAISGNNFSILSSINEFTDYEQALCNLARTITSLRLCITQLLDVVDAETNMAQAAMNSMECQCKLIMDLVGHLQIRSKQLVRGEVDIDKLADNVEDEWGQRQIQST